MSPKPVSYPSSQDPLATSRLHLMSSQPTERTTAGTVPPVEMEGRTLLLRLVGPDRTIELMERVGLPFLSEYPLLFPEG